MYLELDTLDWFSFILMLFLISFSIFFSLTRLLYKNERLFFEIFKVDGCQNRFRCVFSKFFSVTNYYKNYFKGAFLEL